MEAGTTVAAVAAAAAVAQRSGDGVGVIEEGGAVDVQWVGDSGPGSGGHRCLGKAGQIGDDCDIVRRSWSRSRAQRAELVRLSQQLWMKNLLSTTSLRSATALSFPHSHCMSPRHRRGPE